MPQLILATDFQLIDPYVGYLKAEVVQRCPNLTITDLCHQIPYSDISLAAYFVKGYLNLNHRDNIILVAVNNFYQTNPRFIAFQHNHNYYIGPDNGVFSLIFDDLEHFDVFQIDLPDTRQFTIENIYTHAIACLFHNLGLTELGQQIDDVDIKITFRPVITSNTIRATIIHEDGFGNVITNLTKDAFDKARNDRPFRIFYNPRNPISHISEHYGKVDVGETVCIWNTSGHLEIGINQGKASTILNLKKNETIQIDFD